MTPVELVLKWLAEVGRIRALEPERLTETDEWLLSVTREYARVLHLWQRGDDPSVDAFVLREYLKPCPHLGRLRV